MATIKTGKPINETDQDNEIIDDIKSNIDAWYSYFSDNIDNSKESKKFLYGDQWEEDVLRDYETLGKVTLTFNKLAPYQRRLSAEVRAAMPAINVVPLFDEVPNENLAKTNEKTAKILENSIRAIFLSKGAKRSLQITFDNQTGGGYGVAGAFPVFKNEKGFDQTVDITAINEPERVIFDPKAKNPTKSDGDFCGYREIMSKKEFKSQYGFEPPESTVDSAVMLKEDYFQWADEDNVVVCDYYQKEYFSVELIQFNNGMTSTRKEYNQIKKLINDNPESIDAESFNQVEIINSRKTKDYKIWHYRLIGDRVLERKEFPSKHLPYIFFDGNSYYLKGQQYTQSFIKDAIDAQKFHNYVKAETVQNIKDSTKEDFLATRKMTKGNEKAWKDKRRRRGVLYFEPDPRVAGGMPVKQPPSQINPELLPLGPVTEADIRSTLGVFESSQGATSTDLSGIAENIRISQGNLSSFVYIDNFNTGLEQLSRVTLDLIKNVNKNTSLLHGVDENGTQTQAQINTPSGLGGVQNDITSSEFDVAIKASSSFEVQRQREYQNLIQYSQAYPHVPIQDHVARKLDSDVSADIASRALMTLPPPVQVQMTENPEIMKQGQQALQQQQQAEAQQKQVQQAVIQSKLQTEQIDRMSTQMDAIATLMGAQTDREVAETKGVLENAKLQAEEDKSRVALQTEILKNIGQSERNAL